jgi:hypothetical protein
MAPDSEIIDDVNFALTCIRVLRHLKEEQTQGTIDSIAYRHISHDLEAAVEELTLKLLKTNLAPVRPSCIC